MNVIQLDPVWRRWRVRLAVILLLAAFAAQVSLPLPRKSLAYDEPVLITAGFASYHKSPTREYAYWEVDVPPLVYRLATLPLLFTPVSIHIPGEDWGDPDRTSTRFIFHNAIPAARIALLSRLALLPLGLLLGWLIFGFTRRLYGTAAGLTALWLYAFEPNLIAYAGIVGNDLAAALAFFGVIVLLHRFRRGGSTSGDARRRNLIWLGAGLGLALHSKLTALLLLPMLVAMALADEWLRWREQGIFRESGLSRPILLQKLKAGLSAILITGGVAAMVLWAGYDFGFEPLISPLSTSTGQHDLLRSVAQRLNLPPTDVYDFFADLRVPYGNFLRGIRAQIGRNQVGEHSYLLGQYSTKGWWYYFPVALAVKLPLPLLVLLGLSGMAMALRWNPHARLRDDLFLIAPALLLLLALLFVTKNIGIRYALPIWPFGIAFASRIVTPDLWTSRRWLAILVAALCGWQAVESLAIYPHHLAYFNQLAGGPENGWRVLADSNVEWGQGLIELRDYMQAHEIDSIHLAYFGRVDPAEYGITYTRLRPGQPVTGYVAISVTHLLGVFDSPDAYAWLWDYEPVDKIGYGIFIYRIDP